MKRELTTREKVLMLILVVLIGALGYYKLILEPIDQQIAQYQDDMAQEQTELSTALVQAAQMKKMETALEELRKNGTAKAIPAYDNSRALMLELHNTLDRSSDYTLDFSAGTTTEGYIVLRPISLTFRTQTYAQSRAIIDSLCGSEYLNIISDLSIQTERSDRTGDSVQTSLQITYFEVMS